MRDALRNLSDSKYWVYGPSTYEFDSVVELIQKYSDYADECIDRRTSDAEVPAEFEEAHAEVSSDLRYYCYIEKGLLWSFALWRLQGMFEALLASHYLRGTQMRRLGLKGKLRALREAGYELPIAQQEELLRWAALRNLLSHMPPEHYHPIAVDREDMEEFVVLLKSVCAVLSKQRSTVLANEL